MSILRSFNIGVAGLSAAGSGLSVIGDNIANAGTTGYKASRPEFQDVLATSLNGVSGGDQFGAGVRLAHIKPIMTQGNVTRTESITDLAISGNGFFQVEAPFGKAFSRDGSFHFNKEGALVNSDGYKVMGFKADENNKITSKLEEIKVGNTAIGAKATKKVKISMNIDSREEIKAFDPLKPDETSAYSNTLTVYDTVGTPRLVTMYFNKSANNNWEYHAMADGADIEGGAPGVLQEAGAGTIQFDDQGRLSLEQGAITFNFNKGAKPQVIEFDFGESITEGGDGLQASTQYGSTSTTARHEQDGFSAATLASLSFNDNGILTAVYDNGETKDISQMAIAKFENNEGLFKMGKNLFQESKVSGQAAMGKPVTGGRGEIISKSLELSNVDIASEFVNLMTSQRNFQASAKTLTTADQMIQEVFNIKR